MADFTVLVVILHVLDVLLASLLLLKSKWTSKSWQNATADLTFCTCTIDLWFIAISRFAIMIGAIVGLKVNSAQGLARLKLSRRPIFCLSFAAIVYVLGKFLASTECSQDHSSKVWLWLFFGHTCLFSLNFSWNWWSLGKASIQEPTLVVNADQEIGVMLDRERSRLKADSDDESVDSDDSSHDRFVSIFFRDVVHSQKYHKNSASCQFYWLAATYQHVATNLSISLNFNKLISSLLQFVIGHANTS